MVNSYQLMLFGFDCFHYNNNQKQSQTNSERYFMPLSGSRTYVGFGFGAIQAGLFLYEAFKSGNFGRLVVAEIVPEVVAAIRKADGYFTVNIAHADCVEQARIGPIEIYNPAEPEDRRQLIE